MDTYGVIIDDAMIDSIVKTDMDESLDLLTVKQFIYFLFLGVIPSVFVYKVKISRVTLRSGIIARAFTKLVTV